MDIIHVDQETYHHMQQSNQLLVVYECKLQVSCGIHVEGTQAAISTHLRRHGITASPEHNIVNCSWGGCSKAVKKDSLPRHILTHMGVKARCSVCGIVRSRYDVIRAHIASSERCKFAFSDFVHGPEGVLIGTNPAAHQV